MILSIFIICITSNEQKIYVEILTCFIFAFLCGNIAQIQSIGIDQFEKNALDENYCIEIQHRITDYEKETGIKVNNVGIAPDSIPMWTWPQSKYRTYGLNDSAMPKSWSGIWALNYYNNTNYKSVEMDDQIYNKYFIDKNWDGFYPDEQMIFRGDTLYLIIY